MGKWTSEDATREVLAVLPLLNRIVGAEVRREAGEDTTIGQFRVLAHLSEGPLTLSVLAKRRRVSLQSMSELAQTLVERGWIARTPDPTDRRGTQITLTAAGHAALDATIEAHLDNERDLIAALSPAEQEQLAGLLRKLRLGLPQR